MDWLSALVLGVVQGLTEYLPVSSSGHLVLCRELLRIEESDLFFDVIVHVATLFVTLVVYAKPVSDVLQDGLLHTREWLTGRKRTVDSNGKLPRFRPHARLGVLLLIGTFPTGLVGVLFKSQLEALFDLPPVAYSMLLVTAALLVGTRLTRAGGRTDDEMTWRDALVIGTVQGLAIIPGISRSGSTIAAALFLGLDRELAARYSFLLSVPAIFGALLLKLRDVGSVASRSLDGGALVCGFLAALITGYFALIALLPLVKRGRLHWFALYLVPVALWGIINHA